MIDPVFLQDHDLLPALRLLRVRFWLRTREGVWPRFKGFLLHGALGATLHRLAPETYSLLMGDSDEAGRPYVLLPPLDEATAFLPGSLLPLEICFIGDAEEALPLCMLALTQMGAEGIGQGKARFDLASASVVRPMGEAVFLSEAGGMSALPSAMPASDFFSAPQHETVAALDLSLVSPLRLKADNRLVRHAPDFAMLMQRLLGRVAILNRAGVPAAFKHALLESAAAIQSTGHRLSWVEWPRHSSRQGADMLFGGLVGELRFSGDLSPFVPWLRLAEFVHLGGKTTFGLGAVRLALE